MIHRLRKTIRKATDMPAHRKRPEDIRKVAMTRLPPPLLERLDRYCATQRLKPSRTRVIEIAIADYLDKEEATAAAQA